MQLFDVDAQGHRWPLVTTSDPNVVAATERALRERVSEEPGRPGEAGAARPRKRHAVTWNRNPDLHAWGVEWEDGEKHYRCLNCAAPRDMHFAHVGPFSWLVCGVCRRAAHYGFGYGMWVQPPGARVAALRAVARCHRVAEDGSTASMDPEGWLRQVDELVARIAARGQGVTVEQVRRCADAVDRLAKPAPRAAVAEHG